MSIPVDLDALAGDRGLAEIKDDFEARHDRQFGFTLEAPLEIANLRVVGKGSLQGVDITSEAVGGPDPTDAHLTTDDVYFGDRFFETPVYDRTKLRPGNRLDGPAIVIEDDSTVVIQPDHVAEIDQFGCIEITGGETQ